MTTDGVYDWRSFDLHYYYRASLSDGWRAWATPNGLGSFFVESCTGFDGAGRELPGGSEFEAGGRYAWRWRHDFEGRGLHGRVWGHLNCRSCWIFFMTNLTSVLEAGRDLRHVNPAVVSSMEVGFRPQTAGARDVDR